MHEAVKAQQPFHLMMTRRSEANRGREGDTDPTRIVFVCWWVWLRRIRVGRCQPPAHQQSSMRALLAAHRRAAAVAA